MYIQNIYNKYSISVQARLSKMNSSATLIARYYERKQETIRQYSTRKGLQDERLQIQNSTINKPLRENSSPFQAKKNEDRFNNNFCYII